MDAFIIDLGKKLLLLLWYISNYTDHDDYSETTRRDIFEDVLEDLYPHCKSHENDIKYLISEFAKSFKGHPYENKVKIFADDFFKCLSENEDPIELFLKGDKIRKK